MAVNIMWNRKPEENGKMKYDSEKPLGIQMLDYIRHMQAGGKSEESKKEYERKILAKVRSGQPLTPAEMSYLAQTNPDMYRKALRAQYIRRGLENRLKSCSSKQEAEEVFTAAMGSISEKDPDREVLLAAIRNAYREFKKSPEYAKLPETEKAAEQMQENGRVSYVVNSSGYQEAYIVDAPQIDR